jgi:U4/U6 small nuclear ribonucleoprotein PRP4
VDNAYQLGGSDDEREREQNAVLIEQLERKKRLRRMAVPTDDRRVKDRLRAYGEPITLFGEGVRDSSFNQRWFRVQRADDVYSPGTGETG